MNEPANFVTGDINEGCPSNKWNNPPYVPSNWDICLGLVLVALMLTFLTYFVEIADNYLASKTICPAHVESLSRHYDTHNMYGWFESEPTLE